jgi:hypothetical protein
LINICCLLINICCAGKTGSNASLLVVCFRVFFRGIFDGPGDRPWPEFTELIGLATFLILTTYHVFFVTLNEVKDLKSLKVQDS